MPSSTQPVEILMVDDDALDYELFRRQMTKQRIANATHHVANGEEALAFLRRWHEDEPGKRLVVLMDVNMPGMSGLECIREIRADEKLRGTVVFVMTSSRLDRDIAEAYELNVAGYLVKDDLGPSFVDAVTMLDCYWRIVELPESA